MQWHAPTDKVHMMGNDTHVGLVKPYRTGMYGGKFMPLHKGHRHCIEVASLECERVYAILFFDRGPGFPSEGYLSPESRWERLCTVCAEFDNVVPARIDTTGRRSNEGTRYWDSETPDVLRICGNLDAVYSSEPSYGEYFARAYPQAVHRLVDPERTDVPISGTMIRKMDEKERMEWTV